MGLLNLFFLHSLFEFADVLLCVGVLSALSVALYRNLANFFLRNSVLTVSC